VGVTEQDPQQLGSHVAAGPGDGDAKMCHGALYRLEYWNFWRAPG
jgi:hypothetical protein